MKHTITDALRKSLERVRDLPDSNYGRRSGSIPEMPGWSGYTNGYALVAIESDAVEPEEIKVPAAKIVKDALAIQGREISRETLAEFAGSYPVPVDLPSCDECGGEGRVECKECKGTGEISCECHCGDEHDGPCDECDGDGGEDCSKGCALVDFSPKARPGVVGNLTIDLNLLALIVAACPLESVQVKSDSGKLTLRGDGWIGVLMPVRDYAGDGAPRLAA